MSVEGAWNLAIPTPDGKIKAVVELRERVGTLPGTSKVGRSPSRRPPAHTRPPRSIRRDHASSVREGCRRTDIRDPARPGPCFGQADGSGSQLPTRLAPGRLPMATGNLNLLRATGPSPHLTHRGSHRADVPDRDADQRVHHPPQAHLTSSMSSTHGCAYLFAVITTWRLRQQEEVIPS
ncbi:hypothetical protein [Streptomyces sp. NPDC018059]|uniref:hypothetical protein n=1 Tax=Streptomyces sp. NPDC018059 TaxID=3365041 RepID=UPI00378C3445